MLITPGPANNQGRAIMQIASSCAGTPPFFLTVVPHRRLSQYFDWLQKKNKRNQGGISVFPAVEIEPNVIDML